MVQKPIKLRILFKILGIRILVNIIAKKIT